MAKPQRARIYVDHRGVRRYLCKVAFVNQDASFYLIAADNDYEWFAGLVEFLPNADSRTINLTQEAQVRGPGPAKLSLHASGQVHFQLGGRKTKARFLPRLVTYSGEHIATLQLDCLEGLPVDSSPPKTTGRERDYSLPLEDSAESGAIAVYATYRDRPSVQVGSLLAAIQRPDLQYPVFVEFRPVSKLPLAKSSGMTIVSGFHPFRKEDPFLFARGQESLPEGDTGTG